MPKQDLAYLRRALARCRSRETAPARRYPAGLRQEVTSYALSRSAAGASWKHVAEETAASLSTLQRWVGGAPRRRWRRVEVAESAGVALNGREPMGAVLVSPQGYRVEGLDVAGLAALVSGALGRDPLGGDLFLFVSRNRKRAKVIHFDGTGLCVYAKRLEQSRFACLWKGREHKQVRLTKAELELFLEGSALVGRVPLSPPAFVKKPIDFPMEL